MNYYAGIGSRETPGDVLLEMEEIGAALCEEWTLRSGCAPGADTAFEQGATFQGGFTAVELFLPWPGFEKRGIDDIGPSGRDHPQKEAFLIAADHHPAWDRLKPGSKSLHARNVHQILGPDVNNPVFSRFVICWTRGGKRGGGTGQAIRLADHYGIPIFDLGIKAVRQRVLKGIRSE